MAGWSLGWVLWLLVIFVVVSLCLCCLLSVRLVFVSIYIIFKEMSWGCLVAAQGCGTLYSILFVWLCACVCLLSEPSDFVFHPIAKAFSNCE